MNNRRDKLRQLLEDVPDEGLDDIEETIREAIEYWEISNNYNPPPMPQPRTFIIQGWTDESDNDE